MTAFARAWDTMVGALRRAAPATLLLALAACGSSDTPSIYREAGVLLAGELGGLLGREGDAPQPVTRAQLDEIPFATILVGRPGSPLSAPMFAAAVNDDYVTYVNAAGQSVTLRGGQVTATHGLIADLAAYRSDPGADPEVTRRPPEAWPQEVVRVYRDRDAGGRVFSRTMICRPRVLGPRRIEIAELGFDVVEIEEPCASPTRSLVNRYWVEPATGFMRRSEQWAGLSGPRRSEVVRGGAPQGGARAGRLGSVLRRENPAQTGCAGVERPSRRTPDQFVDVVEVEESSSSLAAMPMTMPATMMRPPTTMAPVGTVPSTGSDCCCATGTISPSLEPWTDSVGSWARLSRSVVSSSV